MTQDHAALERLHEIHRPDDWRHKLGNIIEHRYVELIILLLIFCDILLVSVEIGIDHHYLCVHGERVDMPPGKIWKMDDETLPSDHAHASFALRGLKVRHLAWDDLPDHSHSELAGLREPHHSEESHQADGHEAHNGASHHPQRSLVCEDRNGHHTHHVAHTCHLWSIVILFVFLVELLIKLAINPSGFMHNRYHVLDLTVVVLSIIIDTLVMYIIAHLKDPNVDKTTVREEVELATLLLIVCRIWRVARIFHGVFEVVQKDQHEKEELQEEVDKAKAENEKLQEQLAARS